MTDQHNGELVIVELDYDRNNYTAEEVESLYQDLKEFGPVRLREHSTPAAGWGMDIYLALSFIGGTVASSLIGHITEKFFDNLAEKIRRFYSRRRTPGMRFPRSITLSYDDMDITIDPISDDAVDRLPELMTELHERIIANPPKDKIIHRITIGVEYVDNRWQGYNLDNPSGIEHPDPYRYWRTEPRGNMDSVYIYDSYEKQFYDEHTYIPNAGKQKQLADDHELLTHLLEHSQGNPADSVILEPDNFPIVGFREPNIESNEREIIDIGTDEQGHHIVNGKLIAEENAHISGLIELRTVDSTVYYITFQDFCKLPQG